MRKEYPFITVGDKYWDSAKEKKAEADRALQYVKDNGFEKVSLHTTLFGVSLQNRPKDKSGQVHYIKLMGRKFKVDVWPIEGTIVVYPAGGGKSITRDKFNSFNVSLDKALKWANK